MRRVTREDVDRTLRVGLIALYAIILAAGLVAWVYLPPSLVESVGGTRTRLWALYMILGGIVALVGVLRRRGAPGDWVGEFIGLPMLASAVGFYGAAALTTVGNVPGRAPGGMILVAFAVLMVVRWFRVLDDAHRDTETDPGWVRRLVTRLAELLHRDDRPPTNPRA